ncbi:unnamed protein product [Choristocarpus tenellus]
MPAYGRLVCTAAKLLSESQWDHIGVVVRDKDGTNILVEASFGGVKVRPLSERLARSSAAQICVRRLQLMEPRTESLREEARHFVSQVANLPYKDGVEGLLQMASATVRFHPVKNRRRRLHAEAVGLSALITSLSREMDSGLLQKACIEAVRDDVRSVTRRAILRREEILAQLASIKSPSFFENVPEAFFSIASRDQNIGGNEHEVGGMFCSELVAALYQRLGLLDSPFPASNDYIPADFAYSLGDGRGVDKAKDGSSANIEVDGNIKETDVCVGPRSNAAARSQEGGTGTGAGEGSYAGYLRRRLTMPLTEGGRIALLHGAKLGPGQWLRGGPPSSCGLDGTGRDGLRADDRHREGDDEMRVGQNLQLSLAGFRDDNLTTGGRMMGTHRPPLCSNLHTPFCTQSFRGCNGRATCPCVRRLVSLGRWQFQGRSPLCPPLPPLISLQMPAGSSGAFYKSAIARDSGGDDNLLASLPAPAIPRGLGVVSAAFVALCRGRTEMVLSTTLVACQYHWMNACKERRQRELVPSSVLG